MNTRLQVEHPVTEEITGVDLVELQLRCAAGEPLPLSQSDVRLRGHAFEVRINAEDPSADFAPQTGFVSHLRVPEGVRWESGIERGSRVTPHYDPLLAKLVVSGSDREAALRRLARALDELLLGGIASNTGFQRWLVRQSPVLAGRVTTRLLEELSPPPPADEALAAELAAQAWVAARDGSRASGPWGALGAFRVTPHRPARSVALADRHGALHEVPVADAAPELGSHLVVEREGVTRRIPASVVLAERSVAVGLDGHTHTFRVLSRSERWAPTAAEGHGAAEETRAPFPAVVTETPVRPGQAVAAGDVVVVIEAMKMLHSLTARGPGVVAEVRVGVGDAVESQQVLVTYVSESAEGSDPRGE
jgi:acetyl/propionyl-CoA carboxylase alpha subunit